MTNAQRAAAIAQQIIDQHISGVHAVLLKKKTSDELRAEMARNTSQMNALTSRNDVLVAELAARGLKAIEPPADELREYTLAEVTRGCQLSDWANFVAVDANGVVCEYECRPTAVSELGGVWVAQGLVNRRVTRLGKVVPPFNFRNCLFKIQR